jgi:Domain of unknown function (DUF4262)
MTELSEILEIYLKKSQDIVDRYGWMIQGVGTNPFWAYTVGMNQKNISELVIVGLPPKMSKDVLNDAAALHVKRQFSPGETVDVGWSVRMLTRQIDSKSMNVARILGGDLFQATALQLLWPDKDGVFDVKRQTIPD